MLFSNPEARSLLANRHRRTPCVLLVDTSGSMEGEKIRRLNAGFRAFRDDILRNPMAAQERKFTLFTVGVGVNAAGRQVLNELSQPFGGRCLDLDNLKFEEMFLWLSGSLSRVSQSSPGERVQLVDPTVGDELYEGWVL